MCQNFLGRLTRRRPFLAQSGASDGARRLGAAGDDARVGESPEELLGQTPRGDGVEPTPEADPGTDHDQFRRIGNQSGRLSPQVSIVHQRQHMDHRCPHDLRASTFEERRKFFDTPFCGQGDSRTRQIMFSHRLSVPYARVSFLRARRELLRAEGGESVDRHFEEENGGRSDRTDQQQEGQRGRKHEYVAAGAAHHAHQEPDDPTGERQCGPTRRRKPCGRRSPIRGSRSRLREC